MIKRRHIFIALAVMLVLAVAAGTGHRTGKGLTYEVFSAEKGWGYDILVNGNVRIHQDIVPGQATYGGYATKEDAETAARSLISQLKVKKRKMADSSTVKPLLLPAKTNH